MFDTCHLCLAMFDHVCSGSPCSEHVQNMGLGSKQSRERVRDGPVKNISHFTIKKTVTESSCEMCCYKERYGSMKRSSQSFLGGESSVRSMVSGIDILSRDRISAESVQPQRWRALLRPYHRHPCSISGGHVQNMFRTCSGSPCSERSMFWAS